ncbi:uncharacterized protein GGS22DRAFT_194840 [Annulohypoxylon maeteangense]|uniref:uncharacterized protein n=1 Tax=Annulohypoxylon maeteangense TaxID=1927788 RepID=UPI00200798FB|nr:uncharacterized protein GGS22DRAFT_194840 [Annulohypoxylon maeteangense]KAI0884298.1 hypothetical protein GGS22DRAFT_194840 [Annulohypoxylon maeteangense]
MRPLAKPKDVIKALTGSWIYLNVTTYYDNGTIAHSEDASLGKSPVGMITYQPTWMSATFMSSRAEDRPPDLNIDTPALPGPDAEWALIGKHTMAYAGPWHVSETTEDKEVGQVTHGPTWVAWLPAWVGKRLVKNYVLYDEGTTLRFLYKTSDGNNGDMWFRKLREEDDDSNEVE